MNDQNNLGNKPQKQVNQVKQYHQRNNPEPDVAPGMTDYLELSASREEKEKGEFTKVTTLSFDETH